MNRQDRQNIFNEHSEHMLNCGSRDKKEETKVYDIPIIIEERAELGNVNLLHKKSLSSNIIDNLSISHNQSKYDEFSNSVIAKVVDGAVDKINESIDSDKNTIEVPISKIHKISNPLITDRTFSFQDSLDFFKNLSKYNEGSNDIINNEVVDKIVSEKSTSRVYKNSQQLLANRTFSFQDSLDFFKNLSKSNEGLNDRIENDRPDEKCDSIYSLRIDVSTTKLHKYSYPLIINRTFSFQDSLNFFKNLSKSNKGLNNRTTGIIYQKEFKNVHVSNNHDRIKTYQKDNLGITNY